MYASSTVIGSDDTSVPIYIGKEVASNMLTALYLQSSLGDVTFQEIAALLPQYGDIHLGDAALTLQYKHVYLITAINFCTDREVG